MPACHCMYFSCNGQLVDDKTRKRHQRFEDSQAYHKQSEHNANNVQDLPELQDTIPKSATPIDALAAAHKVVSREGHTWRNQASIPVATKTLRSLVELEQRAATQISAIQNLKSPILTSPPNKSLIDEIKTRRTEMEIMLATLIVLWCNHDPVAMHTKEDLELQLQKGIKDLK
ncbi:hypothetical protein EI94DRAFT_1700553 [Lactarius quietus]|nr:hypothetical protein EI94DRAFT_1700553 [Lactarius quietus]